MVRQSSTRRPLGTDKEVRDLGEEAEEVKKKYEELVEEYDQEVEKNKRDADICRAARN